MAASLVGLGLLWAGGDALGQTSVPGSVTPPPVVTRPTTIAQTPPRLLESPPPPLAGPAPAVERIRPVAITSVMVDPEIQLVVLQQGGMASQGTSDESATYDVLVEPPGPLRVFRFDSEAALKERMRQEALQRPQRQQIEFPPVPEISKEQYLPGRKWEPLCHYVEPNYVCHGKLLFEEKNSERFGWDLGFVQPAVSTGAFCWDMFFLPYHCATAPGRAECSAGYRLPGDPIPYMLYPPELSLSGMMAQSNSMLFLYRFFPGQVAFPADLPASSNPTEGASILSPFLGR